VARTAVISLVCVYLVGPVCRFLAVENTSWRSGQKPLGYEYVTQVMLTWVAIAIGLCTAWLPQMRHWRSTIARLGPPRTAVAVCGSSIPVTTAKRVRSVYESSFPPEQRRPFETLLREVEEGTRTLWLAERVRGFALTVDLKTIENDVYLDYLAVDSTWRSRGIGSRLLHDVHAMVDRPLIFEVERPESSPCVEGERRVAFYHRNGASELRCSGYLSPSITGDGAFPMMLFAMPQRRASLAAGFRLEQLISEIWVEIYGRDPRDPTLLRILGTLSF
jgi:GNAT superfamily N-acetyltransferase